MSSLSLTWIYQQEICKEDGIPAFVTDLDGSLEQTKRATVKDEMWLDTVQAAISHFVQR